MEPSDTQIHFPEHATYEPGNRIFRMVPDFKTIFAYLDEVCYRDRSHFVVDDIVYKRIKYDDRIFGLYNYLKPFYHSSKRKYVDGCASQSGFLTILRQICNLFCIQHQSKILYRNATYVKTLTIYVDRHNWEHPPESSVTTILRDTNPRQEQQVCTPQQDTDH